jgi:hypothetical protein
LADRIDFEELALKGVDPSMGPKISNPRSSSEEEKKTVLIFIVVRCKTTTAEYSTRTRFRSSILKWMALRL